MSNKTFSIERKSSLKKDIKKLPKGILSISFEHIRQLKYDPLPYNSQSLKSHKNYYKIRVASYRIIYHIDYKKYIVTILAIQHRKDVYDKIDS